MLASNRVTKATIFSLVMLGATMLASTESRGDGAAKPLTPEQASAKAAFQEAVKENVEGLKKKCGIDLVVTTDFENYDRNTYPNSGSKDGDSGGRGGGKGGGKLRTEVERGEGVEGKAKGGDGKGGGGDQGGGVAKPAAGGASNPEDWKRDQQNPRGALRAHSGSCATAIDTMAEVCSTTRERRASAPPPPAVKGIACLIGGLTAAQSDDRHDDFVQRNMSFANGVLTFHISASRMGNLRDNVFAALRPVADKTDILNGAQCVKADQCRSRICSKGVCAPCGPQAACSGATETCGTRGICFHKLTPAEERERDAEDARRDAEREAAPATGPRSSSTTKKGLGQSCQFNAECESKICGTLSSGSLHKCTNRH